MTTLEWAQFLSIVGFIGYTVVTAFYCARYIRRVASERVSPFALVETVQPVLCLAMFIVMVGLTSAVGALAAAPFRWISAEQAAIVRGVVVWLSFVGTAVGVIRYRRGGGLLG